ncbi:MAG: transposase [Thomasclavelia sp.]|uniref:transposase n=1 Tax=Thomasclavelia sp. TaxID=3025757 RepID=UPI0039A29DC4
MYKNINTKIKDIEAKIIKEYRHIHTIKGISEVPATGIYAEFGEVHNYMNHNQILAYAGIIQK